MKKKAIKHIPQFGPTCGIYCISMVLEAFNSKKHHLPVYGQKLAHKLLILALDKKMTNIGEFFNSYDLAKFINVINEVIPSIEFKADVLEFNDLKSMKKQITGSLNSPNTYIIFPILPCKILTSNKTRKMDIAHWIILEKANSLYISGLYSQKNKLGSKIRLLRFKKLFKRNQLLNRGFNWKRYYALTKPKNKKRPILKTVYQNSKKHLTEIKVMKDEDCFINYDNLKGKMIVIQKIEIE
ncbi:hypothetical protein MKX83_24065 [Cytobacillus sp. FSL M8-0252]|uniref:hypothetical protein n=1 Tax=Cytobacillus sp. FSL M8-0252 TaxID=2921621 RepID=UPI0030F8BDB3